MCCNIDNDTECKEILRPVTASLKDLTVPDISALYRNLTKTF